MSRVAGCWQMQAWDSRERLWRPMEEGAAGHVWKPRATLLDAVRRCLEWTGGLCIPAMQVVDVETGLVWWRDYWTDAAYATDVMPRVLAVFDGDPAIELVPEPATPGQAILF